jgi:DNA-binding MarR family transcriptional regulator
VTADRPVDTHEAYVAVEREIGLLLRRSRAMSTRLARELHPELDGAAYGLLALLADAGPLRATDLVVRLGLDKSTVSRQVSSLVELGLVGREAPSAEGAARLARIREARRARWEEDLSHWPVEDVARLGDLLGRFNRLGEAQARGATAP